MSASEGWQPAGRAPDSSNLTPEPARLAHPPFAHSLATAPALTVWCRHVGGGWPLAMAAWRAVGRVAALGTSAAWLSTRWATTALADATAAPPRHHAGAPATGSKAAAAPPTTTSSSKRPPALQEGTHFAVFAGADGTGRRLGQLARALHDADVVLLGEVHDDPVAHALQLELLRRTAQALGHQQQPDQQPCSRPRPLVLSLEQFETDAQAVVDEWLAGAVPLSDLIKDARPWSNYVRDYHPLVEHCQRLGLPVVAANAPRRYVSLAGRAGSDALLRLPQSSRQWLPPLPHAPASHAYAAKVQQSMQSAATEMAQHRRQQQGDSGSGSSEGGGCPHIGLSVSSNFMAAQSLWDATMAHSIARALARHQAGAQQHEVGQQTAAAAGADSLQQQQQWTPLVLHVCGKFHCEDRLGIPEHLQRYAPHARVLVVTFVPSEDVRGAHAAQQLAAGGRDGAAAGSADYVVLTDGTLPRSFESVHPV